MPIGDARWTRLIQQQVTGCNRGKKRRYSRFRRVTINGAVLGNFLIEELAIISVYVWILSWLVCLWSFGQERNSI